MHSCAKRNKSDTRQETSSISLDSMVQMQIHRPCELPTLGRHVVCGTRTVDQQATGDKLILAADISALIGRRLPS